MIIKCVSRKANVGQLIKYVLTVDKVNSSIHESDRINWFVPGIHFNELDIHHLNAEYHDTKLLRELEEQFQGDVQKFIAAKISEAKERHSSKSRSLQPTVIRHNVRSRSINGYIKEFEANEKLRLHLRKDSVKAYHTILSFSHLDNKHITEKMLKDIAQQYISVRGPDSLFLGAVHQDKEHIHIHLIQSGTQYCTGVANRISRQQFQEVKRTMQEYQKDKYPELIHSLPVHGKSKSVQTIGLGAEKNIKRNERNAPDKTMLVNILGSAISTSRSPEQFLGQLPKTVQPYYRSGRLQGVLYEDRKFRFSRLGFGEQLKQLENMKEKDEMELQKLQQFRGASKDRLTALEKKEREQNQKDKEMFDESKLCDDCKKEKEDPSYDNPKFYTNGVFDMEKYSMHSFEEFGNIVNMDAYLEMAGQANEPTVEFDAPHEERENDNSEEMEAEDDRAGEDAEPVADFDRNDDDLER